MKVDFKDKEITEKIIGAAYDVHNKLGWGFMEKVYRNALKLEMEKSGLKVEIEKPIKVYYEGEVVGDYFADMVVEGVVVVELKALEKLKKAHEVQLMNYLKATEIEIGLLINFGEELRIRRKFFDLNK